MAPAFEKLPPIIAKRILSFLPYAKLAALRSVNRWFNKVCSNLLNETFLRIKAEVDAEITKITNQLRINETENDDCDGDSDMVLKLANVHLKYKILQILKFEIRTLHLICERYVKRSTYCFSGGKLLDYFYEIMRNNFDLNRAKNPLESHCLMQLFLCNEEFMDHFEGVVEPTILEGKFCPWFGTKVVDVLDLYVNSNYHVVANCQGDSCQVSGRYEILKPESTTELKFHDGAASSDNLLKFSCYARNQMRWHNLFFYVDATFESMNVMKKRDRRYSKFCLNSGESSDEVENIYNNEEITIDKFNKTFSRRIGNPCVSENVAYAIELQCSKSCVPSRLQRYVASLSQGDALQSSDFINEALSDPDNFIDFVQEASTHYDFLLTLKVVLPTDAKDLAVENYIELYHSSNNCEISEKSKEIPL